MNERDNAVSGLVLVLLGNQTALEAVPLCYFWIGVGSLDTAECLPDLVAGQALIGIAENVGNALHQVSSDTETPLKSYEPP